MSVQTHTTEPTHTDSNHPDHETDDSNTVSNEKFFLKKIRTQYNEELNYDSGRIASKALTFKHQFHQNAFDELLEALEDHQDEHGYFIDASENDHDVSSELNDLLQTPQASTDDPHTVEDLIIHRHVYELLYNLLLAAHFEMKQRKSLLLQRLFVNHGQSESQGNTQVKNCDIISDFLATNTSTMQATILRIFDDIVRAHYQQSVVFLKTKKTQLLSFITAACQVSFEMLIAEHELSWFPLLFTDPKTTFITPVVRYDKVIKKHQKLHAQKQSLPKHRRGRTYSHHKASSELREGINVSYDSLQATQILYYTFPGIIDAGCDKIYHSAEAFTCATPSIFLRHDLNWIFCKNDQQRMLKLKLQKIAAADAISPKAMNIMQSVSFSSVCEEEEDESDEEEDADADAPIDPYRDIAPLCDMHDNMQVISKPLVHRENVLQKQDFTSKAQLIQDWSTFHRQSFGALCELLSDGILDHIDACDDEDEDEKEAHAQADIDVLCEQREYDSNRTAVRILLELMMQCRLEMKSRMNAARLSTKYNASYLNMLRLYKYFCHHVETTQKISIRTHGIVKNIVQKVYRGVILQKNSKYKRYRFLSHDADCKRKLHEFIAECGELMASVFYHDWDVCPLESDGGGSACMQRFDAQMHCKDSEKSKTGSRSRIDYVVFPGLCSKSGWHQFDQQYRLSKIEAKQIQEFIKCKIVVCLDDDQE